MCRQNNNIPIMGNAPKAKGERKNELKAKRVREKSEWRSIHSLSSSQNKHPAASGLQTLISQNSSTLCPTRGDNPHSPALSVSASSLPQRFSISLHFQVLLCSASLSSNPSRKNVSFRFFFLFWLCDLLVIFGHVESCYGCCNVCLRLYGVKLLSVSIMLFVSRESAGEWRLVFRVFRVEQWKECRRRWKFYEIPCQVLSCWQCMCIVFSGLRLSSSSISSGLMVAKLRGEFGEF